MYIEPRKMNWFDFEKKNGKSRDLEISKIPNIDEIDGIYMTSPRGRIGRKPSHRIIF